MIMSYFNVNDLASDEHSDQNTEKNSEQIFLLLLNYMAPST